MEAVLVDEVAANGQRTVLHGHARIVQHLESGTTTSLSQRRSYIEARTTQIQMVVARTSPRRLCLIRSGVSLPVVCRLEYPPELPPRRRPMVHLVRGSRATWRHRPSSTTESRQQVLVSHVGRPPIEPSPCLLRGRRVRWHRRRADLDHVPEGAEPAVPQYRLSSVGLAKVARTPPRITSPLRRPSEPKPRSLDSSRPTRIHR